MSTAHPKFLLIRSQNMVAGGSTNNCSIHLAEGIHRVKSVSLRRFSIPNTIYNIQLLVNDAICLTESSTDYQAIVAAGSYTTTTLASAIETAMNNSGASYTYTVTYNSVTMHFSIDAGFGNNFELNWASHPDADRGMFRVLGFDQVDWSGNNVYESTNAAMLSSPLSVLLRIPEFGSHSISGSLPYSFDIPLNVNAGSLAYVASSADYPQVLDFGEAGRSFQQVSVIIIDHDNNIVDFNGADWELLVELHYLQTRTIKQIAHTVADTYFKQM